MPPQIHAKNPQLALSQHYIDGFMASWTAGHGHFISNGTILGELLETSMVPSLISIRVCFTLSGFCRCPSRLARWLSSGLFGGASRLVCPQAYSSNLSQV
jgi:hypothetical protein